VHVEAAPRIDAAVYDAGACPSWASVTAPQLIAQQLGGEVARTGRGEYGRTQLQVVNTSALFEDLPPQQDVWMSHFDAIIGAPDGFRVVASTPDAPVAALESPDRQIYGVQFHPEVAHTPRGQELLKNFLFGVCGCRPTWTHTSIIEQAVDAIRTQVGDEEVICGLPVASTPPSPRRWCTRRSATNSPACTSTTA